MPVSDWAERLVEDIVANLEWLAEMDEEELAQLKQRRLWRAYSLMVELMGKIPE
jgi:hypothetical protein